MLQILKTPRQTSFAALLSCRVPQSRLTFHAPPLFPQLPHSTLSLAPTRASRLVMIFKIFIRAFMSNVTSKPRSTSRWKVIVRGTRPSGTTPIQRFYSVRRKREGVCSDGVLFSLLLPVAFAVFMDSGAGDPKPHNHESSKLRIFPASPIRRPVQTRRAVHRQSRSTS